MGDLNQVVPFGSEHCVICKNEKAEFGRNYARISVRCPRCGNFQFNPEAGWLEINSLNHMVRLSGWVRQQNNAGDQSPKISLEKSRQIGEMLLPGFRERALQALIVIAREWANLTSWTHAAEICSSLELLGRSFSVDHDAAYVLIKVLTALGFLEEHERAEFVRLAVEGLLEVEKLGAARSQTSQGFVAMSFDPTLEEAWSKGLAPAVREAGYQPLRIDQKEFVGGISDQIIAEIRRSRFVVSDYTDHRHGVYFEAGFALGLGLTVIPTCRADNIKGLHFDIAHLNTLVWKTPEDIAEKLGKRILAVVGPAPPQT